MVGKRHSISHLLMSERLTETGSPKIIIASMLSLFTVFFALIVWAGFTTIDEVAVGSGEIVPMEQIIPVQHLEGGIVYKVYVKDGEQVSKGELLFELNPEPNTSDLNRLEARQNSLEINIFRLQAQLSGKAITDDDILNAITYKDVEDPALLKLQISNAKMYQRQELEQIDYNQAQLASRLLQERNNLKNIQDQLYHLDERKAVIEAQLKMYDTLTTQQAVSKVDLLNVKERQQQIMGDLLNTSKQRTTIESTVLELENKLKTFEFDKENQALKELNDNTSQLLEVREQISRAKTTVAQLKVKSEADGIVKGFALHPGDVVTAGAVLFDIVPISSTLVAEIKILPNDIGQITIGDPVQVKVSTYDFATYGSLEGKLTSISASTFLDPEKKPYYKCGVTLEKTYLGEDPAKNNIFPGMTVTAEIKTGHKSLLKYMLKPINKTFNEAFKEQ
jgi:adhesin transport system membrane fusion protein